MMTKQDKLIYAIFLILFVIFISLSSMFLIWSVAIFTIPTLIATILCTMGTIGCFYLALIKEKGYKIKYCFSNKKYNEEIAKSLAKFDGAPQKFIDNLKKVTEKTYRRTGHVFTTYYSDSIYRDKEIKEILLDLYTKLYNSILSKGGFIEFFKQVENKDISSYEIYNYIINSLISSELRYLLNEVYYLTQYTTYDNGLSEEFTLKNNKMIDDLNNIYSPLLFNFKDELEMVLNKLNQPNQV